MVKKMNKFAKVAKRIEKIKEAVGGDYVKITEEDNYDAIIVGVTYREDVISEFDGVEKIQDKISYIFAVPVDDGVATLRAEYTVSNYEQAKLPPMLSKFGLEIDEFYEMVGKSVRISVSIKTSKKGKEYPIIDKIMKLKKGSSEVELDEELSIPYFYVEDVDEENMDIIDGVVIQDKPKDDKPKRTKVTSKVVEDYDDEDEDDVVSEEIIEDEDDPFDDIDD